MRLRIPTVFSHTHVKSIETHGTFSDVVSGSNGDVQEITERLRRLIVDVYPDVVEVAWPKQRIIGYGVGQKKMSEQFCYIGIYREHANAGGNIAGQYPGFANPSDQIDQKV